MTGYEFSGQPGPARADTAGGERAAAAAAVAALSAIWSRHRDEVLASVAVVDEAVRRGLAGRPDDGACEQAARAAHKLAGSAGTFGFAAAGEIAGRLEDAFVTGSGPPLGRYPALAELALELRRELAAGSTNG